MAHHTLVRHILSRIATAMILLWMVATLTFALVRVAPGDPAQFLIAPDAPPEEVARLRTDLGLDKPPVLQYATWLGGVLRADLGESLTQRRAVTAVLADALPVSFFLGGVSLLLSFLLGSMLGLTQAANRGTPLDRLLTVATTTAYAAPTFWVALALVAVFTYGAATWGFPQWLRLPAFGMRDPAGVLEGWPAFADLLRHALLPIVVLTLVGAAGIARYSRAAAADVLTSDYVRTARAKGASTARVHARHVLRNALPPLIVLFALALPGVLAGSVFVESVFAWPGMGRAMLNAIAQRDYPVVLGATIIYAALVILANLAADVTVAALDPRRRD